MRCALCGWHCAGQSRQLHGSANAAVLALERRVVATAERPAAAAAAAGWGLLPRISKRLRAGPQLTPWRVGWAQEGIALGRRWILWLRLLRCNR